MQTIEVENFDLAKTLECGQFFRYEKVGDFYFVSHKDRLFKVEQEGDTLYFNGVCKRFLSRFFRLDDDYSKIIKSISKDKHIKKAIKANAGLRLIRQDPWECLISFMCSSNANIPKITKNVTLLSEIYGKMLTLDEYQGHTFPEPGTLAHHDKIFACKTGYRADFIYKANNEIDRKQLLNLRKSSYENAKNRLMKLHGVGEKIADCVCMFSLDKLEAFPVDVWIKRVMQEYYFDNKEVKKPKIREFGMKYFGEYAGYANMFLFTYVREQK